MLPVADEQAKKRTVARSVIGLLALALLALVAYVSLNYTTIAYTERTVERAEYWGLQCWPNASRSIAGDFTVPPHACKHASPAHALAGHVDGIPEDTTEFRIHEARWSWAPGSAELWEFVGPSGSQWEKAGTLTDVTMNVTVLQMQGSPGLPSHLINPAGEVRLRAVGAP